MPKMKPLPVERVKCLIAEGRVQLRGRPERASPVARCAIEGCGADLGPLSNEHGRELFILFPSGSRYAGVVCRSCAVEIRARWQPGVAVARYPYPSWP